MRKHPDGSTDRSARKASLFDDFPTIFQKFSPPKRNSHQRQWWFRKHSNKETASRISHMKSLFPESLSLPNNMKFRQEIACTSSGNLVLWKCRVCRRIDVRKLIRPGFFFQCIEHWRCCRIEFPMSYLCLFPLCFLIVRNQQSCVRKTRIFSNEIRWKGQRTLYEIL